MIRSIAKVGSLLQVPKSTAASFFGRDSVGSSSALARSVRLVAMAKWATPTPHIAIFRQQAKTLQLYYPLHGQAHNLCPKESNELSDDRTPMDWLYRLSVAPTRNQAAEQLARSILLSHILRKWEHFWRTLSEAVNKMGERNTANK